MLSLPATDLVRLLASIWAASAPAGAQRVDNGVDVPVEVSLNRFQLPKGNNYGQGRFPFGDAGGNGQRLTLSADVVLQYTGGFDHTNPNCTIPEPGYVEISSSSTPDTYCFYQSRQRYYYTNGNPFAEPAPLYFNVRPVWPVRWGHRRNLPDSAVSGRAFKRI